MYGVNSMGLSNSYVLLKDKIMEKLEGVQVNSTTPDTELYPSTSLYPDASVENAFDEVELGLMATVDVTNGAYVLPAPLGMDDITWAHAEWSFPFGLLLVSKGDSPDEALLNVIDRMEETIDVFLADRTLGGNCRDSSILRGEPEFTAIGALTESRLLLTLECKKILTHA